MRTGGGLWQLFEGYYLKYSDNWGLSWSEKRYTVRALDPNARTCHCATRRVPARMRERACVCAYAHPRGRS